MKKLLAAAFLSLIAAGLSGTQASAGYLHNLCCKHCCCDKGTITLRAYNAFTPVACAGIVTNHCVNVYPCGDAGPCCNQNPFAGGAGYAGGEVITLPAQTAPAPQLPATGPGGGRPAFPPMPSTTPPSNGTAFQIQPGQTPLVPSYGAANYFNANR
jgi:hypothetical protein